MSTTAEPTVASLLDKERAATAALRAADAAVAERAALAAATKPATRAALKAEADSARKEIAARRIVALDAYAQQILDVHLTVEAVADAHTAMAAACTAADEARRRLNRMRQEIERSFDVERTREAVNASFTEENRMAYRDAQAAFAQAMADMPPAPAPSPTCSTPRIDREAIEQGLVRRNIRASPTPATPAQHANARQYQDYSRNPATLDPEHAHRVDRTGDLTMILLRVIPERSVDAALAGRALNDRRGSVRTRRRCPRCRACFRSDRWRGR
jgi:hypothetical protein